MITMEGLFVILTGLLTGIALSVFILKKKKILTSAFETVIFITFVLAVLFFSSAMYFHANPYYQAIDPVDGECYSPIGAGQAPTVIYYALLFFGALILFWKRRDKLPPLTAVICAVFLLIGLVLNVLFVVQLVGHDPSSVGSYTRYDEGFWLMLPLPVLNVFLAIWALAKFVFAERRKSNERTYQNRYLQGINQLLASRWHQSVWVFVFLFPVLLISSLILFVFGQDYNSLVKVFTDTATWTFSQKMHPPILEHRGHYLCTVAACGSPKLVKPIRLGKRGGRTIIVNRQLQIANAFEECVHDLSPALHRFIRTNYDRYGYNLSKKITSPFGSNLTYMLMKPLEWVFLICLYICCTKPEEKISRQYV